MDEKNIQNLNLNDELTQKILDVSSREEIKTIFEKHGESITDKELDNLIEEIQKAIQIAESGTDESILDKISGGKSGYEYNEKIDFQKAIINAVIDKYRFK